jgi:uncharacterized protein
MTATNAPSYATELRAEQKAHEPSMEDILASIRRMIADDDVLPLSRRARSRLATPETAEAAPSPKAPADAFLGLVQRLGRDPDGQTPDILPPPAAEAAVVGDAPAQVVDQVSLDEAAFEPAPAAPRAPTLKLRDFALKNFMARATVSPDAPPPDAPAPSVVEPEASASPPAGDLRPSLGEAATPIETAGEPSLASPGASVVMLPPRPSHTAEIRLKIAPLTFRAPSFAASPPVALAPDPEPVAEAPAPAPAPAALLSPASDAKIGASFEALAESLLARDKDLVERAARDMLRPMLKSWLDDNLPSLVERLVRAEIERVARGRG